MKIYKPDGGLLLDISVDDDSYRQAELMGRDELILKFSLAEFIDIPVGAYCHFPESSTNVFQILAPTGVKINNRRNYEYSLTMEGSYGILRKYRIRNMVDGRLKFDLVARPHEHLQQLIDNLNDRRLNSEQEWVIGTCIDDVEKLISYNHTSCDDALTQIATTFETEFEVIGHTIHLRKVEYNKLINQWLNLSYGRDNGLIGGFQRNNSGNQFAIERLWVQGGDRNIDYTKYGAKELMLPDPDVKVKYDGEHFGSEEGYNPLKAREYCSSNDRRAVINTERLTKGFKTNTEDSLDLSDIYPKREGKLSDVRYVYGGRSYTLETLFTAYPQFQTSDWNQKPCSDINIDLYDDSIPSDLDFKNEPGEQMTIIFQSGMLAGKEFVVVNYVKSQKKFELQREEIDNFLMPSKDFPANIGDKYAIFNCSLPDEYYREAELEMLKRAAKYLYEHEEDPSSFRGTLDGIWSKKNWDRLKLDSKIVLGGRVMYRDESVAKEGVFSRITRIKTPVNNPHSPTIEISNEPIGLSASSSIKNLENETVHTDELYDKSIQFTKRNFRQAEELISAIAEAVEGFSEGINPVTVQSMAMLIGSMATQYKVYDSSFKAEIPFPITSTSIEECGIKHFTLGIDNTDIQPESANNKLPYKKWIVSRYPLSSIENANAPYYVYAKVQKSYEGSHGQGEFIVDTNTHKLNEDESFYHLLVGILSSEDENGNRSFAPLYGFTEILPNQIRTGAITDENGKTRFDLTTGTISLNDKGGISGNDSNSSIAAWFGGTRNDRENVPSGVDPSAYATSLFRFDGTGYLAMGLISWSIKNGRADLIINGASLIGETGVSIGEVASFKDLFILEKTSEGHVAVKVKNSYKGLVIDGLFTDGFISAGGKNTESGGGGGGVTPRVFTIPAGITEWTSEGKDALDGKFDTQNVVTALYDSLNRQVLTDTQLMASGAKFIIKLSFSEETKTNLRLVVIG